MVFACDELGADVEGVLTAFSPVRRAQTANDREPVRRVNVSDQPELSPEQLAARCQAGCPDSFEQIVLLFEDRVFNFIHQFTRNRHDAEDLTQVTFVKAYRSLPRYNPLFAFAPWLFCIARRTAASHFRSADRFEELTADCAERSVEEADPANLLARKDESAALWQLARTLKPKLWEVLWLRYGEEFSIAEIAGIMRTNQVHVKVLLHRGRAALGKKLGGFNAKAQRREDAREGL